MAMFALWASAYDISYLKSLPDQPEKGKWVQCIKVDAPQVLADISADTPLIFEAKGMERVLVRCGRHILTPEGVNLDSEGKGSVTLNPKKQPSGPINIQIIADNAQGECDIYELQLWNAATKTAKTEKGMPKDCPAVARGMKLDFYDDFDRGLSISKD